MITASGSPLFAKTADYLRDIQKTNIDQIVRVYDRSKPTLQLNVFGSLLDQVTGTGGSNVRGTTKVFSSEKLSNEDIIRYAQLLTGFVPFNMRKIKVKINNSDKLEDGILYNAKLTGREQH